MEKSILFQNDGIIILFSALCRCFSLSGHHAIREVISECQHLNTTVENCTLGCAEAIDNATASMGCCLNALLSGSEHEYLLQPELWDSCGQNMSSTACTWCSASRPVRRNGGLLVGLLALSLLPHTTSPLLTLIILLLVSHSTWHLIHYVMYIY